MKTLLQIFSILFCIVSCKSVEDVRKPNFKLIEITINNGWTGGGTIHIDSLGVIIECKYHIISEIDSVECYTDTLSTSQMDSIILNLEKVETSKINSIYDSHCEDCGSFIIKVISLKDTIESMIIGLHEFDNALSNFANHISNIKIKHNKTDSICIFETTKFLIPAKPTDSMKKAKFIHLKH